MFGAMQIFTGLLYGMPMPAQPLKAMAVLVISQKASGPVLYGAGLAIGIIMLVLASTGLLTVLANAVPKSVVRGIQFGLGLQLATLALRDYVPAEGTTGFLLAGAAFLLTLLLLGNRRFPPAPFVLALGFVFALAFRVNPKLLLGGVHFVPPAVHVPTRNDIWVGLYLLAIPQLALSFGNSILASRQVAADLFPERPLSIRKIGLTYSAMNLINPFFGGVPTCHGSGGIAGHYTFGARTGGSVIIYGMFYLVLGLFFSLAFQQVIPLFPRPVLGVMLLFEPRHGSLGRRPGCRPRCRSERSHPALRLRRRTASRPGVALPLPPKLAPPEPHRLNPSHLKRYPWAFQQVFRFDHNFAVAEWFNRVLGVVRRARKVFIRKSPERRRC